MKLLHIGDLHLGKSLGEFDLRDDQEYILDQIIGIIKKYSVDAVLIAGDVYDRAVPSEAATRLLDRFLGQLAGLDIHTFMISGNHDSDDRLNYGSSLFKSSRIYISAVYDGTVTRHTLTDEYGQVDIYSLPFVKASTVRHFFPEASIESYEDAVRTIIENENIDKTRRNVIIAHQFVAGKGRDPVLGGSEGPSVQRVGLVEKIGYDSLEDFDYAALGHIHSPQRMGREGVRYSGSPLKYSLSEVNDDKSVPIITLKEKGTLDVELVPLIPKRDVRHLKGTMAALLSKDNVRDPEDFIYATLTDEEMVGDAMGIFQQVYPNTVKLDYDNSHTRQIEHSEIRPEIEDKSFVELIKDFYEMMYGCEINDDEMDVMKAVAKEAGVIDETD